MLEIASVTKTFDGVVAVDDLSFTVPEGVVLGFLGPNGSGKTTTMRMVLDILRPDRGTISWRGAPITDVHRRRFGYMPEERGLYPKMKVGEQLLFFARLYGMEPGPAQKAIDAGLERFDIADRKNSRLDELSKGNQQKVQVLAALIHEPDLALLDEPFTGLDPVNTELLEDALFRLRDRGKTVIFSSHRLEQVEELCKDVVIIAKGHQRLVGNVDTIRSSATRRVIHLRTESAAPDLSGLPLLPLASGRDYLRFALEEGADSQRVLETLASRERVLMFALERPTLEEIFMEVTGGAEVLAQAGLNVTGDGAEHGGDTSPGGSTS
jgi:ABC-2 type transport system ATP-binding protein